jgi:hypothetical protein
MHKRDTDRETWKSSTQQLNFLEHTIMDGIRWQEAWKLADEQKKAAAKPLHTWLSNLLYLVMNSIWVKGRRQDHKHS